LAIGDGHASHRLGVAFTVNCTSRSESSQLLNTVIVIMACALCSFSFASNGLGIVLLRKASNRTTPPSTRHPIYNTWLNVRRDQYQDKKELETKAERQITILAENTRQEDKAVKPAPLTLPYIPSAARTTCSIASKALRVRSLTSLSTPPPTTRRAFATPTELDKMPRRALDP
jgi:hypothetical protein